MYRARSARPYDAINRARSARTYDAINRACEVNNFVKSFRKAIDF